MHRTLHPSTKVRIARLHDAVLAENGELLIFVGLQDAGGAEKQDAGCQAENEQCHEHGVKISDARVAGAAGQNHGLTSAGH